MSRVETEVLQLKETLDKAVLSGAEEEVADVLTALAKIKVSMELLRLTKVGISVHGAKKQCSGACVAQAKDLLSLWKKALEPVLPALPPKKEAAAKAAAAAAVTFEWVGTKKVKLHPSQPIPTREGAGGTGRAEGFLIFPDFPHFTPNLTPKEVIQLGSFGGTYYRPIHSSVTGK
jgi:hypothetical protein